MAKYELVVSGVAVPIRRPLSATWNQPVVGDFAHGLARKSAKAQVTWTFPRLRASELQVLLANFSITGVPITFRTFRPPYAGFPAAWVLCTGIMQPVDVGNEVGGFYDNVSVTFNRVQVV